MFATSRQPCLRTFMVIFPLRRILFVPRIDVKKHCILSYLCEVRAVKVRLRCVQWAIFAPSAFRPASAAPEVYCETLRGRRPGIISRRSSLLYRFFFIRCFDNVFRDIFVSFSLLYALFPPLFSRSLSLYKDGGDREGVVQGREKTLGCTNPLSFSSFSSSSLNMGFYLMHIVFPLCLTI